jgi:hypothetical protein
LSPPHLLEVPDGAITDFELSVLAKYGFKMSVIQHGSWKNTLREILHCVNTQLRKKCSELTSAEIAEYKKLIAEEYEHIAGQWFVPKDINISPEERAAIDSMRAKNQGNLIRFLPTDKNMGVCVVGY